MRYLSLAALKVALADLFANRHVALVTSNAGKMYEPVLLDKKTLIDALPTAFTGGKPFADELTSVDKRHDGFGTALWHITEAYQRWPDAPADLLAAVARVRAAFVPQLDVLQASYVNEAHAAMDNEVSLTNLEADLKAIPIAGGLSLHDWCAGFVASGKDIAKLLGERADADTGARREASKLRTSTLAVLGRFRGALADEMALNKALPADLDRNVFGYFDELAGMRADALAGKKAPTPPTEQPPG
ncbi:MAG: hypothetical protein IPM54_37125 [Polyangiaceae bacterium]|nr:hypothetical protein [Polyangiaceae bacterium]